MNGLDMGRGSGIDSIETSPPSISPRGESCGSWSSGVGRRCGGLLMLRNEGGRGIDAEVVVVVVVVVISPVVWLLRGSISLCQAAGMVHATAYRRWR